MKFKHPRVYQDFHNHFGGVLPLEQLIYIYYNNFSQTTGKLEKECKDLFGKSPFKSRKVFREVPGLTLRLIYYLTQSKYKFKGSVLRHDPERGAHDAMLAIIYLVLIAFRIKDQDFPNQSAVVEVDWNYVIQTSQSSVADFLKILLKRAYQALLYGKLNDPRSLELCRSALHKMLRATRITPFDDAYVGRSSLLKMFGDVSPFNRRAFSFLQREKIDYCEMSQPIDKIPASDPPNLQLRWLALIASHRPYLMGKAPRDAFAHDLYNAVQEMQRRAPRIVGIDLAGPEGYEYLGGKTKELVKDVLQKLNQYIGSAQAKRKKVRQVVFRPHVGEGSALLDSACTLIERRPWEFLRRVVRAVRALQDNGIEIDAQAVRPILDEIEAKNVGVYAGKRAEKAAQRAIHNLDAFIGAIEQNQQYWNKQKVLIRFGHATHTTPEQAKRMQTLGIWADINLGSNLRTGALAYMPDVEYNVEIGEMGKRIEEYRDYKKKCLAPVQRQHKEWNWNASALVRNNHGLGNLLQNGVPCVLGTDGQGVEVTNIACEYDILESYLLQHSACKVKAPQFFDRIVADALRWKKMML